MNTSTTTTSPNSCHSRAHWLLRIALASIFIYYGIDKFLGGGIAEFSQFTGLPLLIATLVALTEIGAGIFVLLGGLVAGFAGSVFTRLGAFLVFPVMLGAIFMVHWGQWHMASTQTHPMGGMGFQVTLLLVAAYLFIRGNEA